MPNYERIADSLHDLFTDSRFLGHRLSDLIALGLEAAGEGTWDGSTVTEAIDSQRRGPIYRGNCSHPNVVGLAGELRCDKCNALIQAADLRGHYVRDPA